jgi:hypothetical protein
MPSLVIPTRKFLTGMAAAGLSAATSAGAGRVARAVPGRRPIDDHSQVVPPFYFQAPATMSHEIVSARECDVESRIGLALFTLSSSAKTPSSPPYSPVRQLWSRFFPARY